MNRDSIKELNRLASHLANLTDPKGGSPMAVAYAGPSLAVHNMGRAKITFNDDHWSRDSDDTKALRELCAKVKEAMTADLVAEAEAERDRKLKEIAAEIEATRDALSSILARAIIEAGQIARSLGDMK